MRKEYRLSNVTKNYLNRFYFILDEMVENMNSANLTDSISQNFISQMIPHHRAAIEMSENILKYTTLVPLQEIAESIIDEQTKSICNMREIYDECGECVNTEHDLCLYERRVDKIISSMSEKMKASFVTNNINADFMYEMIPHHQGALEMSQNALQYNVCKKLNPIIDAIITSQQRGICQMRRLLRRIGY